MNEELNLNYFIGLVVLWVGLHMTAFMFMEFNMSMQSSYIISSMLILLIGIIILFFKLKEKTK